LALTRESSALYHHSSRNFPSYLYGRIQTALQIQDAAWRSIEKGEQRMHRSLQRGPALGTLLVACLIGLTAVGTVAEARPSKQGIAAFGDTEFAALHRSTAYAATRRAASRPQTQRVAALDPSTSSTGSKSSPTSSTGSKSSSSLVAEARRWIGTNPTGRSSLWCADFMNFVLSRTGHRVHNSRSARSFASYGRPLPGPQVGAIAVLSRGAYGGHVGIVTGFDRSGNPIIISGNVEKRVEEIPFPRSRVIAYVAPLN
jgi:uncharacterized protein (TIGR02594 family)